MKAALLVKVHEMTLVDVDPPRIEAPDQVLIKVHTVGVCGSEVHAFQGTHPYRKAPVILGHEAAGDVIAVGDRVAAFRAGDRVVVDPQWTCGECAWCRNGMANLCPSKKVLGTSVWPGAFGEIIVAPESAVFALPDRLSYAQGSLIEPLTIAVHVARQARLQAGESVAILGTGSVGGLLSGVARARGASPIITADVKQHCLDAARECLGATHDFLLPSPGFADQVHTITHGDGVDVVFITADDPTLVNLGLAIAKRRARIVLVALLTESPLQFPAFDVISKELTVIGSLMATHDDVRTAIDLAARGRVDMAGILTHSLPLAQAQRAMELAHTKDDGAIKVVLTF